MYGFDTPRWEQCYGFWTLGYIDYSRRGIASVEYDAWRWDRIAETIAVDLQLIACGAMWPYRVAESAVPESDEARVNRLWLDEMEAQCGWFSAADER